MFHNIAVCLLLAAFMSECKAYIKVNGTRCIIGDSESDYPSCPDFRDDEGACMVEGAMLSRENCISKHGHLFYSNLPKAVHIDGY